MQIKIGISWFWIRWVKFSELHVYLGYSAVFISNFLGTKMFKFLSQSGKFLGYLLSQNNMLFYPKYKNMKAWIKVSFVYSFLIMINFPFKKNQIILKVQQ